MAVATAFGSQIVTLVIGFALTTVVGGALGPWFQRRGWDHQNDRSLAESDRDHATQTCRELSQLMDKRLYRIWQVKWAIFATQLDHARIEQRMDDYRAVLVEWNDPLMRNLAATEIEFGSNARELLEGRIYEGFAAVGREVEQRYTVVQSEVPGEPKSGTPTGESASQKPARLRGQIYRLNVLMLEQIRDGQVGRHAPK